MLKHPFRLAALVFMLALTYGARGVEAQKLLTLETPHFRVAFEKKYSQLGGEVLRVAESVWPTLARAYDSYNNYQRIDILITDQGDDANGFAIYNFSRVEIFAPHMDWVMRNRQTWIQNVVTHELAHVFSLRRAAWLSPVDAVYLNGSTYNYTDRINYSFQIPWIPLIAPTWYVEGIAQFEAAQNGNDSWDSQRDMVLRDAYLTGTLPTLDFIETFDDDEDWTQAERTYNTGFAFLLYLKDRFGVDRVRKLAEPKALNFSFASEHAFGKPLTQLFEDFKHSLADRYSEFKDIPRDEKADKDMSGGYQQNLTFSPDGRYMAWLGNDEDRRAPLNWIYWKEVGSGSVSKSAEPANQGAVPPASAPAPSPAPKPMQPQGLTAGSGENFAFGTNAWGPAAFGRIRSGNPVMDLARNHSPFTPGQKTQRMEFHREALGTDVQRSELPGSDGLEFNRLGNRLLTTRQYKYSEYTDIWEYDFKSNQSEDDKWRRLTWEERAAYPSYHPVRDLIVYSRKKSGSSNLALLDSTGRTWQLTNFTNGEQVYNPRFTPKGDSVYFTLGILDKEAIVAISAGAPAYDPFLTMKDSAAFPDSLNLGRFQKLAFITPLRKGSIRNLRFSGDTLFWSANMMDSSNSVFDVYARVTGDSAIYRATHVAGQALEALPHNGTLYYQGYLHQRFQLFQQPLALTRTPAIFTAPTDTLPTLKPKKEDFSKVFESGEYSGTKVALDITPFLGLQPQFISGNRSYTDLALGLSLTFGEAYGSVLQSVSGAITKRSNPDDPLNYQVEYAGFISSDPIRHTSFTFPVDLYYSFYHDVLQVNGKSPIRSFGVLQGLDSLEVADSSSNLEIHRYSANLATPLPYNFQIDANYWLQTITETGYETERLIDGTNSVIAQARFKINLYRDAPQHRHINTGLNWSWSKSKMAAYLPTGGGVAVSAHKWWARYGVGADSIDYTTYTQLSQAGDVAPQFAMAQEEWEPWSFDLAGAGAYSLGKLFTVFGNVEGGAFLNRAPVLPWPTQVDLTRATNVDVLDPGLWAMTYRLGYYKLSGYPYNFTYRGRDLMEGSSYGFGQVGVSVPLRAGKFLPDLPVTSLKQFMLTGLMEGGTTLVTAPDEIYNALDAGDYHLLVDFGLRLSMNFRLYHQLPFTVYAQVFQPWNNLSADKLYWDDYPHTGASNPDGSPSPVQIANSPHDRAMYINTVQDPRFYVGFNLGLF